MASVLLVLISSIGIIQPLAAGELSGDELRMKERLAALSQGNPMTGKGNSIYSIAGKVGGVRNSTASKPDVSPFDIRTGDAAGAPHQPPVGDGGQKKYPF